MIIQPPSGGAKPSGPPGSRRAAARQRRRFTRFVIGAGVTTAFALTLVVMHYADRWQSRESAKPAAVHVASPAVPDAPVTDSARMSYRYSIVPGGVRSAQEVAQAMESDPVVMDHYGALRPSKLREEEIKELTLVHASYRIGDKVFWTKKKLALKPGEKVLTDGTTTIRERCGNLLTLSVEPLAPALIDEPVPPDFDEAFPFVPPTTSSTFEPPPNLVPPVKTSVLEQDPIVAVPEPSTWVLVGLGLTAGIVRYLTKRTAA